MAKEMAKEMSKHLPYPLEYKVTAISNAQITEIIKEASFDDTCAGIIDGLVKEMNAATDAEIDALIKPTRQAMMLPQTTWTPSATRQEKQLP